MTYQHISTDLTGKVAIVTGGARGIGRAYSAALAKAGAAVVIADLRDEEGAATAEAIVAAGGKAAFFRVDVSDEVSTTAMAAFTVETFGGIDILINNAGMFATLSIGPLSDISVERWDRTFNVNVKGVWLCTKAVWPAMKARGGGSVVNKSSISAFGHAGGLDYCTSKAAVIGITKASAYELGQDNIRVNAIAPGGVVTEGYVELTGGSKSRAEDRAKSLQIIKKVITTEDVVGTMMHLVGDGSRLVTGQTFIVDGGRYFTG